MVTSSGRTILRACSHCCGELALVYPSLFDRYVCNECGLEESPGRESREPGIPIARRTLTRRFDDGSEPHAEGSCGRES